jgi:hypothetical protein
MMGHLFHAAGWGGVNSSSLISQLGIYLQGCEGNQLAAYGRALQGAA